MGAAVCIECGPVSACDDDRCCLTCGRDLIVVADAGSVDVLTDAIAEAIAEARAEGEAAGRAAERAAIVEALRLANIYAAVAAHNAEVEPETAGDAWRSAAEATVRDLRQTLVGAR